MKKLIIYKHRNKINDKVYIGFTSQKLNKRFKNGEGYKNCPVFYNAIKKYGWSNFETSILTECSSFTDAYAEEKEFIKLYDSTNRAKGYNVSKGGYRLTNSNRAITPWNKGYKTGPLSEEHKEKIRSQLKGKKHPNNRVKPCSEECKEKISKANTGKIRSKEMNEKNRLSHLGKKATNESKAKCSETMINLNPKPVYGKSLTSDEELVFLSPVIATKFLNMKNSASIINCCRGRTKSSGGFVWKYISMEEYERIKNKDIV